jgi:hypothetical protein
MEAQLKDGSSDYGLRPQLWRMSRNETGSKLTRLDGFLTNLPLTTTHLGLLTPSFQASCIPSSRQVEYLPTNSFEAEA